MWDLWQSSPNPSTWNWRRSSRSLAPFSRFLTAVLVLVTRWQTNLAFVCSFGFTTALSARSQISALAYTLGPRITDLCTCLIFGFPFAFALALRLLWCLPSMLSTGSELLQLVPLACPASLPCSPPILVGLPSSFISFFSMSLNCL